MFDGSSHRIDMQLDRSANVFQKYVQGIERPRTKRRRAHERRDTSRLLSRTDGGGGRSRSEK